MAKQFDGAVCVLCGTRPSSRTGEHVWTEWFFEVFPVSEGRYTTSIGGRPVLRRDGQPRQQVSISRVKLPMCVQCNGVLNQRFEEPAKEIVRRVMASDGQAKLTGPEAMQCALWFLKTWLLLAHPAAVSSEPAVTREGWEGAPEDLWSWTVDGSPPPDGLSLWVHRPTAEPDAQDEPQHVMLPTVVADGTTTAFRVHEQGVRAADSFLQLTVVFHPGWAIDHPLEAAGRALRLWPRSADDPIDFAALPAVAPNELRWRRGLRVIFAPGTYEDAGLPALSSSQLDLAGLPGVTGVFH